MQLVPFAGKPDGRRISQRDKRAAEIDKHVAQRLVAARKLAGISQEKAGATLGLTFQQVQKYERGTNRISAGKLAILAGLYRKPVAWFFESTDKPDVKCVDDPLTIMAGAHGGAELARNYLLIKDHDKRSVLCDLAAALAKR